LTQRRQREVLSKSESEMKIGVLGSGDVAKVLASGFIKHGHDVMLGTRDSAKLADWSTQNPRGRVGGSEETARFGELLVLAVKGTAAAQVLGLAGAMLAPLEQLAPQANDKCFGLGAIDAVRALA
jgi:3-hydroxyisobutyrate dehydrogenase-like beta-hydroxyacid dehydrogenase